MITKRHNLPEAILKAARRDNYSRGKADISVTSLIDAPQIFNLREKHYHKIETDVSERIWALLGTAVHKLLEEAEGFHQTEERLYAECGGLAISGGIDVQMEDLDDGTICVRDYKVCQITAVQYPKIEWERQLNLYSWLIRKSKGKRVSKLQIVAFTRDWRRREAFGVKYPEAPISVLDIPLWDDARQDAYVEARAALHKAAMMGASIPCTREEQWSRADTWATYKGDNKKATRVYGSEKEAIDSGLRVEHRPGGAIRCDGNYCGVRSWCPQYQEVVK